MWTYLAAFRTSDTSGLTLFKGKGSAFFVGTGYPYASAFRPFVAQLYYMTGTYGGASSATGTQFGVNNRQTRQRIHVYGIPSA